MAAQAAALQEQLATIAAAENSSTQLGESEDEAAPVSSSQDRYLSLLLCTHSMRICGSLECGNLNQDLYRTDGLLVWDVLHRQRRSVRTLQQPASIAALTDKDIEAIVAMACNSNTAMPSIWGVRCRAHACSRSGTISQS